MTRGIPDLRQAAQASLLIVCLVFNPVLMAEDKDDEVSDLLTRMSTALRDLDYQGRFVYVLGNHTASFELQHALIGNKEHERLVFLNQQAREVVRIGHDVFCVHTGHHLLRDNQALTTNPFSTKLEKIGKGLQENYLIEITRNDERVAGREAIKLSFKARDELRYDHLLWIDSANYLLLKSEIRDARQGSLETFEYVQLDTQSRIPESEFEHEGYIRHEAKHYEPLEPGKDKAATALRQTLSWQASWLPDGFYFSGGSVETLENGEQVTMLMYADGLATVTVFIQPVEKDVGFSENSQSGALSAFSKARHVDEEVYMLTALGELPLNTLERIVAAVSQSQTVKP